LLLTADSSSPTPRADSKSVTGDLVGAASMG
jgi:hypothetical protein